MHNITLTEKYIARNIELDTDTFDNLAHDIGESTTSNHFTIDKDTFQEFDVTIPDFIGSNLYDELCEEFDNKELDYIHIYRD